MKVIFIRQFDLFFENSLKQFLYYFNLNVLDKNFKNKVELLEFFQELIFLTTNLSNINFEKT